MVCPKCGKTLPDNAKFCGFCGTKLDDAAGGLVPKQEKVVVKPTAAVQTVERAEGSAIVKPHAAGSKKPLLIAAAVVAVLALAALLFVLFGGRGSNNAYVCLSERALAVFEEQCKEANATMQCIVERYGEENVKELFARFNEFRKIAEEVMKEREESKEGSGD